MDRLARLNITRSSLESRRADLLQQLDELDRSLKQNGVERAEFAPVNIIPEEILRRIFDFIYVACTPHDAPYVQSKCDPLPLTYVCRRWRRTAIALTTIWTCLHLDRRVELFNLFAKRSMGRPLHIVHMREQGPPAAQTTLAIQLASRWKSVMLGPLPMGVSQLFHIGPVELPLLEYVDIDNSCQVAVFHALGTASTPNLIHLKLVAFRVPFRHSDLRSLRYLYLGRISISGRYLFDLSAAAPQLSDLTLDMIDGWEDDPERTVSFPCLKKLTSILMDWEALLEYIDTPCLQTLGCDKGLLLAESSGTLKSYPSVTCIRFSNSFIESGSNPEETLFDGHIFQQMPFTTRLELIDCPNIQLALRFLCTRSLDNENLLLKRLRTLVITQLGSDHYDILLELVRRRTSLSPPLEELKLGEKLSAAMGSDLKRTLAGLVTVTTYTA